MKKKYLFLMVIAGLIVAVDQLIKMYVHVQFKLGESISVIPGFFNITYVRNFGAAFGFLAESHPSFREVFFLAMPPVALVVILLILRGVRDDDTKQIVALSSVFGGAVGNYIDRLNYRYVIDFLDFHLGGRWSYPAFNVADAAIVCGVFYLLYLMVLETREEKRRKAAEASERPTS